MIPARLALGPLALLLVSCQAPVPPPAVTAPAPPSALAEQLAVLEQRVGGRIGVVVTDAAGRVKHGWRADERFAMCSTFKHLLAAMVLHRSTRGGASLRTPLPFGPDDMVAHAPDTAKLVDPTTGRGEWRLGFAAEAMVVSSDNVAANLVLRHIGGPAALTAWLRQQGDGVTRLDRNEPTLNENAPGDPRDTTTPAAMGATTARLVFGDAIDPRLRQSLRAWMVASPTGTARIRAGLPGDWRVGGKTGTCAAAYNEVAFAETETGEPMVIAIYLDRPKVSAADADNVIAEAAWLTTWAGK